MCDINMKILFIGLGIMGGPMAGHLVNSGFQVLAFNRSYEKSTAWLEKYANAEIVDSLDNAIASADVIISCVGNDDDLNQLAFSENGILNIAKENILWIDHTTSSSTIAKKINSSLKVKNIAFFDAPVSGGEVGAINGKLTIMLGGESDRVNEVINIIKIYAQKITHVGESGSGQLSKMVNQICLAGVLQGLSEGLNFASKAGIDSHKVIEAISQGDAQSWQMDNRAQTMINNEFNFGFAIDLMRKDLNICLEQAKEIKALLPVTEIIDQTYKSLQTKCGKQDTSALIKQFDF